MPINSPLSIHACPWLFTRVYYTNIPHAGASIVPRIVRDARIETRSARSKLAPRGDPYWRALESGLHLGYRKGKVSGKWVVRRYTGERYVVETLPGVADDTQDSNGVTILDYGQAIAATRTVNARNTALSPAGPYTVRAAVDAYIEALKAKNTRTADDTKRQLELHLMPTLGDRPVGEVDQEDLERWHRGMVHNDEADPDATRRSKDTANRVLSMAKAALNRAFTDPKKRREHGIITADAWREVKPFKGVGRARQVHLDLSQCRRLINICSGAFRNLVTATLLTGSRPAPGEIAQARVRDFRPDLHTLSILHSKTGPREVVLTAEAVQWFEGIAAGRGPDALLLPKDDGSPWGASHQLRPMREAVARAKLPKGTSLYTLRHSYASQSLLAGMNLKLLAENLGTSVRMIEQYYGKFLASSRRTLIEASAPKLGLPVRNVTMMRRRKNA